MSNSKKIEQAKFSEMIEKRALSQGSSHMETIVSYCEEIGLEVEAVKGLITKSLKDKIQLEAEDLHYLPKSERISL